MATFLVAHGAWSAGWAWKKMRPLLQERGHVLHTPTYTGLGERAHLASRDVTLQTHIADVLGTLEFEDLRDVVLVGHSYGGMVATGVADRARTRLRHLVYLDAQLLLSGESPADRAPPALIESYKERAARNGGFAIPPGDPEYFGITDAGMAEWLRTKLTAHPLQTYFDPLVLRHPLGNGLPATYIACTEPYFASTALSREIAKATPGWTCLEIPTAHDAMVLMPRELTAMLAAIG